MRPLLKPSVPLLRRTDGVQLGTHPERRVLLGGLDLADELLLSRLDGSETVGTLERDDPAGAPLLRALLAAGVLDDAADDVTVLTRLPREERERLAPDLGAWSAVLPEPGAALRVLSGRRRARVHVLGAGRLGAVSAALLAAAGVGRVAVVDPEPARAADVQPGGLRPSDTGSPRGVAAGRAATRAAPGCDTSAARVGEVPDLALVCDDTAEHRTTALAAAGVPHLLGRLEVDRAVVGPGVLPGRSPCAGCLDHVRTDRDPQWPALQAQLRDSRRAPGGDVVLVAQAAGLLVAQALAMLDHLAVGGTSAAWGAGAGARSRPPASDVRHDRAGVRAPAAGGSPAGVLACLGGTLEMSPPDWRWLRRDWPGHPACGCGASATWCTDPADVATARPWHRDG